MGFCNSVIDAHRWTHLSISEDNLSFWVKWAEQSLMMQCSSSRKPSPPLSSAEFQACSPCQPSSKPSSVHSLMPLCNLLELEGCLSLWLVFWVPCDLRCLVLALVFNLSVLGNDTLLWHVVSNTRLKRNPGPPNPLGMWILVQLCWNYTKVVWVHFFSWKMLNLKELKRKPLSIGRGWHCYLWRVRIVLWAVWAGARLLAREEVLGLGNERIASSSWEWWPLSHDTELELQPEGCGWKDWGSCLGSCISMNTIKISPRWSDLNVVITTGWEESSKPLGF